MDSLLIGLIVALAWSVIFMVVLGLCKAAARADAHSDFRHNLDRKRARERIRAPERMRPAAF